MTSSSPKPFHHHKHLEKHHCRAIYVEKYGRKKIYTLIIIRGGASHG